MSLDNINAAAAAQTALTTAINGKITQIDARVAAKETEVDTFLENAISSIARPFKLIYDPKIIHSKSSLNIAIDPTDNSKTLWRSMREFTSLGSNAVNVNNNFRSFIAVQRILNIPPGFSENPPYSSDTSRSMFELVVTNIDATNIEISNGVNANGLNVRPVQGGSLNVDNFEVPILIVPGRSAIHSLFVRIINTVEQGAINAGRIAANGAEQPVATHGGNPQLAIDELRFHSGL